jgi:SAM-dependent methyltransferase
MIHLLSSNYLSRSPIEKAVRDFGKHFTKDQTVVDIGCGDKPYASHFKAHYIGVDPFPTAKADITADAWNIPLPDATADGVLLTQSLEHIQKTEACIKEIYRILKPGGLVLITVPQTMRVHTAPISLVEAPVRNIPTSIASVWKEDYYRFTKYGLLYLFSDFKPISLIESRTTFSTIVHQFNYFFASLGLGLLVAPIYLFNNILGLLIDAFFALIRQIPVPAIKRFDELVIRGLTTDYLFVAQKTKTIKK